MKNTNSNGLSRRRFLQGTGISAGLAAGTWLSPSAFAGGGGQRDVLVHVFLRGGMDGLTTVVPYGDPALYAARPTLAVPPAGAQDGALDLDGFFGFAPAAAGLMTPFANGHLAVVHAAGSTDPTRSHFDAMQAMESGAPNQDYHQVDTGWLGRHLELSAPFGNPALRAVALSSTMPTHLGGAPDALPVPDAESVAFPGLPATAQGRERTIRRMYLGAPAPLDDAAVSTFDTIALFGGIDFAGYVPSHGATYGADPFGQNLKDTAALIKADVGVEVISLDFGGWDLHNQLGPIDGSMAGQLGALAGGLEAFYEDLRSSLGRVTVVVMSEFGRRVGENGSAGVDHGHGNAMLVMGGNVNGGQVYGAWPGLAPANLDGGDLAITTDYRDVVSEILVRRLATADLDAVFPNHSASFLGIVS